MEELTIVSPDGTELSADFYRPEGEGPFPALLLLHGGAWQAGSRAQWHSWGPFLQAHGIAALASTYRLSSKVSPALCESVSDARAAATFLRQHAAQLGVDAGRLGVLGFSAGAQLGALLALASEDARLGPVIGAPSRIPLVISVNGVFDLIQAWEHDTLARPHDQPLQRYLGGTPMTVRESYYLGSPLYHASTANAQGTSWLFAYGRDDDVVNHDLQTKVMVAHLKRAGVRVHVQPISDAGHFFIIDDLAGASDPSRAFATRLLSFLGTWGGWTAHPRL